MPIIFWQLPVPKLQWFAQHSCVSLEQTSREALIYLKGLAGD